MHVQRRCASCHRPFHVECLDGKYCAACIFHGHALTPGMRCRNTADACLRPAKPPSKYCSPECGMMYVEELLLEKQHVDAHSAPPMDPRRTQRIQALSKRIQCMEEHRKWRDGAELCGFTSLFLADSDEEISVAAEAANGNGAVECEAVDAQCKRHGGWRQMWINMLKRECNRLA